MTYRMQSFCDTFGLYEDTSSWKIWIYHLNKQCPRNKDSNAYILAAINFLSCGPKKVIKCTFDPHVLNNHSFSSILAKEKNFSSIHVKKAVILEFVKQIKRKYILFHKVPNNSYLFQKKQKNIRSGTLNGHERVFPLR